MLSYALYMKVKPRDRLGANNGASLTETVRAPISRGPTAKKLDSDFNQYYYR
jgi:hypothetical protein